MLPGVLLLELVIEALKRAAPRAITSVKFHRALQPGESCALSWKETGDQLHFRCEREAMLIAEGSFMAAAPP